MNGDNGARSRIRSIVEVVVLLTSLSTWVRDRGGTRARSLV